MTKECSNWDVSEKLYCFCALARIEPYDCISLGEIYTAQRKVADWTKRVKKSAQFPGFRSTQFNAIMMVIVERAESLFDQSVWSLKPDQILDKLAPGRTSAVALGLAKG